MTFGSRTGVFAAVVDASPTPGLTYTPVYSATDLVVLATATNEKTWILNGNDNLSKGSNWSSGVSPAGVGDVMTFSTILTGNRQVTIDMPTTVGTIKFDDDNSYSLQGASTLTLQNGGVTAANIIVQNTHGDGAHTISSPLTLASDLNISQNSAGTFTISGTINNPAGKSVAKSGVGTLAITTALNLNAGNFTATAGTTNLAALDGTGTTTVEVNTILTGGHVRQGALTLNGTAANNAGRLSLNQSGGNSQGLGTAVSRVGTLSITNDGTALFGTTPYAGSVRTYYATFDLGNNDLIINTANLADVTDMIRAGMGNTTSMSWAGKGITSSYSQNGNPLAGKTGLGVVRNIANPGLSSGTLLYGNFDGQSLTGNEILVKYTWHGDFNLDGQVTSLDFALLDAGFAGTTQHGLNQAGWFFGDANLDGIVNSFDFTLATAGYNSFVTNGSLALPEPGTLMLGLLGLAGLLAVNGKRRSRLSVSDGAECF